MTAADVAALAGLPHGTEHVRSLGTAEMAAFAMVGRPLPAGLRRRVRVHVARVDAEHLVRTVRLDGVARASALVVAPESAGAQR